MKFNDGNTLVQPHFPFNPIGLLYVIRVQGFGFLGRPDWGSGLRISFWGVRVWDHFV